MGKDFVQIAEDVIAGIGVLRQGSPETMKAFTALSVAATATRALNTKMKELMALAIGIAVHCDGCVAYHAKMAHQNGATREEVIETVALACTWAEALLLFTVPMQFGLSSSLASSNKRLGNREMSN